MADTIRGLVNAATGAAFVMEAENGRVITEAGYAVQTDTDPGLADDGKLVQFSAIPSADNGDGSDGDVTIANGVTTTLAVFGSLTVDAEAAASEITVDSVTGFAIGNNILIHQTQIYRGGTAGAYEQNYIDDIDGLVITLRNPLGQKFWSDATGNKANCTKSQIVKIPQYNNLTLQNSGTPAVLTCSAWNGSKGGILAIKVKGTLANAGKVTTDYLGFRTGAENSHGEGQYGTNGSSTLGCAGAKGPMYGKGYGGGNKNNGGGSGAGLAYGTSDLTTSLTFGGGGGGRGDGTGWVPNPSTGGGGIIVVYATAVTDQGGNFTSKGVAAGLNFGGAAGGSIYLFASEYAGTYSVAADTATNIGSVGYYLNSTEVTLLKQYQVVSLAAAGGALDSAVVHNSGDETVAGAKTFSTFPILPSADPDADYEAATKKYVDDNAGGEVEYAHKWFVSDETGDDLNSGKSENQAFKTIRLALESCAAGDMVEVLDNRTYSPDTAVIVPAQVMLYMPKATLAGELQLGYRSKIYANRHLPSDDGQTMVDCISSEGLVCSSYNVGEMSSDGFEDVVHFRNSSVDAHLLATCKKIIVGSATEGHGNVLVYSTAGSTGVNIATDPDKFSSDKALTYGTPADLVYGDSGYCQWSTDIVGLPVVILYDIGTGTTVSSYKLHATSSGTRMPKDWTLHGQLADGGWTLLDTQSGITWGEYEEKEFTIASPGSYDEYRLTVSLADHSTRLQIADMALLSGVAGVGGEVYLTSEMAELGEYASGILSHDADQAVVSNINTVRQVSGTGNASFIVISDGTVNHRGNAVSVATVWNKTGGTLSWSAARVVGDHAGVPDYTADKFWTLATESGSMVRGNGYLIDAASGAVAMAFPVTHAVGDTVTVRALDITSGVTLTSGDNIEGSADALTIDTAGFYASFTWSGATYGWVRTA